MQGHKRACVTPDSGTCPRHARLIRIRGIRDICKPSDPATPTGRLGTYHAAPRQPDRDRTDQRASNENRSAHADGPARHAVHGAARTGITYPVRKRYTDELAPPWHRPPRTTARRAAEAMAAMTILTPERPPRVYRRLPRTKTAGKIHDRTEPGFPESGTFRTGYMKPKGVAASHGFSIRLR